jgi:NAD(P) transhydrogenase
MGDATYDLIVIGSGPAGEKGAARAAYFGKRVALVERSAAYGGAIANTGVPGKAMRETALYLSGYRKRDLHGISLQYHGALGVHEFLHRGLQVRHALDTWIHANLERHRVAVHRGVASFVDRHTVRVVSQLEPITITGDVILIATGSRPLALGDVPPGQTGVYDSESILRMATVPRSLVVIGGGAIGCEYACLFRVLGVAVTVVDAGRVLLPAADREISAALHASMEAIGVEFCMPQRVVRIGSGAEPTVHLESGQVLTAEAVLVAVGRRGNVEDLMLERAGVAVDEHNLIQVNDAFQTSAANVYAAGDVIGGPLLASIAMEQARMAVGNAFGLERRSRAATVLPLGVWTIPEVSMVGETEERLREQGLPYVVGRARYDSNPRGVLIGEDRGLVKLLFSVPSRRLLGVHIVGEQACELVAPGVIGLTIGATIETFIDACFNYPTLSDMYKYAAYDALGHLDRGETGDAPPRGDG